jgi:predicted DsbA family dithiol-disulfide isomerase
LQQTYDIDVEYVHFPLHPETPAEGRALLDLFGGEAARPRLEASRARLKARAQAEGLEMGEREMTYNSRLAQELGTWAEEQGRGSKFHDLAYRAYFVEGRNIGDVEVLLELAEAAELDADAARVVLTERTHRANVDADWARSRLAEVTGVPTFVAGGDRVVGAQPYEVLEELVLAAGARRRDSGDE